MITRFRHAGLFAFVVLCVSAPLRAETPLEEQMDTMKAAFRSIKTAMEAPVDGDKDKYVVFADELRAAAIKAKEFDQKNSVKFPQAIASSF